MALPIVAKVGLGIAGSWGVWRGYRIFKPKLQSLRHMNKDGHPIQVVVPVHGQSKPMLGVSAVPLHSNNGSLAFFRPPRPAPPRVIAHEASIITPSGAANLSVDNISDAQHALNALGANVPVTGTHTPPTQAALSTFQAQNGLPPTGQADAATKNALQGALLNVAGVNAHIGKSLPVQAGASIIKAGVSTPLGQSIIGSGLASLSNLGSNLGGAVSSGMGDVSSVLGNVTQGIGGAAQSIGNSISSLFSADPSPTPGPASTTPILAAGKPTKDAVCKLQHVLNELGASPALKETGDMDPETVAAVKAFQIAYGLVADGVPGPKTITAIVVAKDPVAHDVAVPSIPKAAAHVAAIAAVAPNDAASLPATAALQGAAANLAAASVNPNPHPAEVNASTTSAMAATASTVAPSAVAEPLAKAAQALSSVSSGASAPPTALSDAAGHLANAAAACPEPTAAASLNAAAEHVSAASTAPNADAQAEHLNAATTHLANAATGTAAPAALGLTAPAVVPGGAPATATVPSDGSTIPAPAVAHGEFDGASTGDPRVPYLQAGFGREYGHFGGDRFGRDVGQFGRDVGQFGWDWNSAIRGMQNFWQNHFTRQNHANAHRRISREHWWNFHRRHFAYIPQSPVGVPGILHHHRHPAPPGFYGEFGVARPAPPTGSSRGYGGGYGSGGYGGRDRYGRLLRQEQIMQQMQQSGGGYQGPDGGDGNSFDDGSLDVGYDFGYIAPPLAHAQINNPNIAPPVAYQGRALPNTRIAPPASPFIRPPTGFVAPPASPFIRPPIGGFPGGFPGHQDPAYWRARGQAMRHDERQMLLQQQLNQQAQYQDPNQAVPYQDPNATDPSTQDPSLDSQVDDTSGATDDASDTVSN